MSRFPQESDSVPEAEDVTSWYAGGSFSSAALHRIQLDDAVQHITSIILRTRNVEGSLQLLAREIFEKFHLLSVGIGIVEGEWIQYRGFVSQTRSLAGRIPLRENLRERIIQYDLESEVIDATRTDDLLSGIEGIAQGARIPIRVKEQLRGVISVASTPGQRLVGEEIEALSRIAEAIGAGLARSQPAIEPSVAIGEPSGYRQLRRATTALAATQDLRTEAARVLALVADMFGYYTIRIIVGLDDERQYYSSFQDIVASTADEIERWLEATAVVRALKTGEIQVIAHVQREADYDPSLPDVQAAVIAPIVADNTTVGAFIVEYDKEQEIGAVETEIIGTLADHIGLALARQNQISAISQRSRQLALVGRITALIARSAAEDDFLQTVLRELRRTFGYASAIGRIIGDRLEFPVVETVDVPVPDWLDDGVPLGVGVTGRVAQSGEAQYLTDVSKVPYYLEVGARTQYEICVPIVRDGDVIGVLNVEAPPERPLSERDVEILTIVADHLGIAIPNRDLMERDRRSHQALQAVQRVSTIVAGTVDPNEALRHVVETIAASLHIPVVSIFALKDETLVRRVWFGFDPPAIEQPSMSHSDVEWRVIADAEPVVIEAMHQAPRYVPARRDVTSAVVVPIVVTGEPVGVISVEGTVDEPLQEAIVKVLMPIANQVGMLLSKVPTVTDMIEATSIDPVTGVPGRHQFDDRLRDEAERAYVAGRQLSLLVIDLDNFEAVNESFGRLEGDRVLRGVSTRLSSHLRGDDFLARYADDEFAVLLPGSSAQTALDIATRLLESMRERPFSMSDGSRKMIGLSIGVATFPDDARTAAELFRNASTAMTAAKARGMNVVQRFQSF